MLPYLRLCTKRNSRGARSLLPPVVHAVSRPKIALDTCTHETPEAQRRAVESWAVKTGP